MVLVYSNPPVLVTKPMLVSFCKILHGRDNVGIDDASMDVNVRRGGTEELVVRGGNMTGRRRNGMLGGGGRLVTTVIATTAGKWR